MHLCSRKRGLCVFVIFCILSVFYTCVLLSSSENPQDCSGYREFLGGGRRWIESSTRCEADGEAFLHN